MGVTEIVDRPGLFFKNIENKFVQCSKFTYLHTIKHTRMTNPTQLQHFEQAARFQYFINTANLIKIGETWLKLSPAYQHVYIRRVLRQCANVTPVKSDALSKFYDYILVTRSLRALINQRTLLITL